MQGNLFKTWLVAHGRIHRAMLLSFTASMKRLSCCLWFCSVLLRSRSCCFFKKKTATRICSYAAPTRPVLFCFFPALLFFSLLVGLVGFPFHPLKVVVLTPYSSTNRFINKVLLSEFSGKSWLWRGTPPSSKLKIGATCDRDRWL